MKRNLYHLLDVLAEHSFSKVNSKNFYKFSIELFFAPMITCFILGIAVLNVTSPALDKKLLSAIFEFIQLEGLHIAIVCSYFLLGLSCLINKWATLYAFFRWLTLSVSAVGFNFSAVIFGVVLGLSIPIYCEQNSISWLLLSLFLAAYFFGIQWVFACVSELLNTPQKNEGDLDIISEKLVLLGAIITGAFAVEIAIYGVDRLFEL